MGYRRMAGAALAAGLAAGLVGPGCARAPETGSAAAAPEELLAARRAVIVAYLEATEPLGTGNAQVAHDVARQGEVLVPALVAMLSEDRSEADLYHLIRLGCTMIRNDRVDERQHPELRTALESAQRHMWYGSKHARWARSELGRCSSLVRNADSEPPADPEGGLGG